MNAPDKDLRTSIALAWAQTPRTARLVLAVDAPLALSLVGIGLLGSLLPLAMAWVAKHILDEVVAAGGLPRRALEWVAIELALVLLGALLTRTSGLLRGILAAKLGYAVNDRILEKALVLDLAHFEDPSTYDRMQNARREASSRPLNVFMSAAGLLQDAVTLASFGVVLAGFSPLAVVLLVLATTPALIAEARLSGEVFKLFSWRAPEGRRMNYLEALLTRDSSVKEVKLYGIGRFILERYRAYYVQLFGEERRLAVRRSTVGFAVGLPSTFALYGCYAWVVLRTVEGALTIGEMTMYLTIFRAGQGSLRAIVSALGRSYEDNLFMSNLFAFLETPVEPRRTGPAPAFDESGYRLRGVKFTYPGRPEPALDGIDLEIGRGEKLAIIGDNGAGKSTLVKLLVGLYRPSAGTIHLDGVPLEEIPDEVLHDRVAAVLQDFVRYQFSAQDNVGLGRVEALADLPRLDEAAERAGAAELIRGLPRGWQTQLGRWFEGGVELSAGQWQKLAVARAFVRGGDILVLDEPTASLDAEAEYALFERFRSLAAGKTAILVSHRFSTVRLADRIIVMRGGKIEEEGSHEALLARDGRYAHLFRLQARGYLDAFT